jgi:hypothetical protein
MPVRWVAKEAISGASQGVIPPGALAQLWIALKEGAVRWLSNGSTRK